MQISTTVSRETTRGRSARTAGRRACALVAGLSLLGLLLLTACGSIAAPQGWAAPVAADGTLLLTLERGKLSARNAQSPNQETWLFPPKEDKDTKLEAIYATPLTANGRVYLGAFSGTFYALDLSTGQVIWQQETGGAIIGGAALAGGTVYVGSSDNRLYAFDAETGDPRWPAFDSGGEIWSSPVVEAGTVYVTSMAKRVYALDAATGQPQWSQPFEADGAMPSTPALAGDKLYVGALDNRLYALDIATGEPAWSFTADNWFWSEPLVDSGVVYAGSLDRHVYALDAASGGARWSKAFAAKAPIRARPVLVGDVLVVADSDGNVYGLDPATGEERWPSVVLQSGVLANPLVRDNEVLLSARNRDLLRVDVQTGSSSLVVAAP